ncbi:hypothetical protein B0H17DRAFT_952862, partial [Mycena rosella]
VTGVSGFVGSHVAMQLLAKGYAVRGTARGSKVSELRAAKVAQDTNFEIVEVEDIATAELGSALKDVEYIIHTPSPLAGRATFAEALESAVRGSLNVLEQAEKAGISKIVLISSWATTMDRTSSELLCGVHSTFQPEQLRWKKCIRAATEEDLLTGNNNPLWNYLATKILVEVAAWKFAKEHPSLALTMTNPPFIYGPLHVDFPTPDRTRLGANVMIYALIAGATGRVLPPQLAPFYCDVHDVARVHVRSLSVGKSDEQKRFLISGGTFTWKAAVEYLARGTS